MMLCPTHHLKTDVPPPIIIRIANRRKFPRPRQRNGQLAQMGRGVYRKGHSVSRMTEAALVGAMLGIFAMSALAAIGFKSGHLQLMPACMNEDGNADGKACIWTHPRTGEKYVVDSSEYRH